MIDRTTRIDTVVAAPPFSRISWGSIIAGTLCAFALQLLLNLVGLGIGLSAVQFGDGEGSIASVGIAAGIWWGLSAIISLIVGGWVAGRLAGVPIRITAALHGASVWALATLLIVFLSTTTLATAVSGAFGAVGQIGQATASAVGGLASGGDSASPSNNPTVADATTRRSSVMASIRSEAQDIFRSVVSQREQQAAVDAAESTAADIARTPADAGQDINALVDRLFSEGGVLAEEDRQQALNVLEQRLGVSPEEAARIVDNWQERYQAAVQDVEQSVEAVQERAVEAANAATEAVGAAAGWTALALALGLIAAVLGGIMGKPEPWIVEAAEDEATS